MDRQTLGEMDLPAHIWEPFAQSRAAIRCSPGFLIYLQGTEATCFYYLKEGRVKSFIQSEVTEEIEKDPELALAMMKYLARTVRLLSHQVDQMAFRPAQWRVARYLLSLADGDDCLQCSQDDIADSVSVSRVTVSRILNDLSRRALVHLGYRRIQILDRPGLERLCQEE